LEEGRPPDYKIYRFNPGFSGRPLRASQTGRGGGGPVKPFAAEDAGFWHLVFFVFFPVFPQKKQKKNKKKNKKKKKKQKKKSFRN